MAKFSKLFSHKIPQFSARHPAITLLIWLVVVILFAMQIPKISFDTDIANLTTGSESEARAIEQAARDFTFGDPLHIVLQGDMTDPGNLQRAKKIIEGLQNLPGVMQIISPFETSYFDLVGGFMVRSMPVAAKIPRTTSEVTDFYTKLAQSPNGKSMASEDKQALLIDVYIRSGYSAPGKQTVADIDDLLANEWEPGRSHITGTSYLAYAADDTVKHDAGLVFPLAALIVVIILLYSFRSLLSIIIPGATVIVALAVTLGFMAWTGIPLTIISSILPVIIVVIGSADGIHVLHKYQEEIVNQKNKIPVIDKVMAQISLPCIMTSLTTAFGLATLYTSSVIPVQEFGVFSALGVMTALTFALSGIPALLAILPPMKQRKEGTSRHATTETSLLMRLGGWVINHSKLVGMVGVIIFVVSALGITNLTVETNVARYFRSDTKVARGISAYEESFGGSSQVLIVVDTNKPSGALHADFLPLLDELETYVASLPLVSGTSSMASIARGFSPDGQLYGNLVPMAFSQLPSSLTSVYLSRDQQQKAIIYANIYSAQTSEVSQTLNRMTAELQELLPDDVSVTVAGVPRVIQFHMDRFSESQIASTVWSVLGVFLMVWIFYRTFSTGVLAILPLVFTIGICFGFMGWFGIPLDAATVLIGSIAIGVGIDYSIHFISRVEHEQNAGYSLVEACKISTATAGHAILINAVTLMAGFGILAFSQFSILGVFGVLMALTMIVSAIAAISVLPALLNLRSQRAAKRINAN